MRSATDEVLDLERKFWTEAHEPDVFEEQLADDAITLIEPMGVIQKRQAVSMIADQPWQDVEMTDVTVREVTPDLVILAYHGRGRQAGADRAHLSSVASTYLRRDGRWQLVLTAHQPWTPPA